MTNPGPPRRPRYRPTRPMVYPPLPPGAIPAQRQDPEHYRVPRNGFGITALILAVAGLVFGVVPLTGLPAFLCGAAGLVFGLLGVGRARRRVASNLTMSVISSVLGGIAVLLGIWGMIITFHAVSQFGRDLGWLGGGSPGSSAPAPARPNAANPGLGAGQIPGDGTFLVGTDIQPGTYRTQGPAGFLCYWERSRDTGSGFGSIITNEGARGRTTVTIKPTDGAFNTSGCQPWIKIR